MYILCALAGLSLLHQLNQYILNFCHLKWRKWRFACEKLSKKQTKYSLLAWKSLCRQSHIVHSLRVLSQHRDFSLVLCRSRNAQHQDHTASAMVMQIWAPTAFLSTYLPPATRSTVLKHRRMLWCSAKQLLWQQLPQSCTVLLTQIPEYPEKCKFFVAASVAQQQKPCLAQSGRWWFVHLYLYLSEIWRKWKSRRIILHKQIFTVFRLRIFTFTLESSTVAPVFS